MESRVSALCGRVVRLFCGACVFVFCVVRGAGLCVCVVWCVCVLWQVGVPAEFTCALMHRRRVAGVQERAVLRVRIRAEETWRNKSSSPSSPSHFAEIEKLIHYLKIRARERLFNLAAF